MYGPRDYHTKWNQSEKVSYIVYTWNLENDIDQLIYKTEIVSDLENRLVVLFRLLKGKGGWEGKIRGLRLTYMHSIIYKTDNQQGPNV